MFNHEKRSFVPKRSFFQKSFDVCCITTDNVEIIFCIKNMFSDSNTEKNIAHIINFINEDENDIPVLNKV